MVCTKQRSLGYIPSHPQGNTSYPYSSIEDIAYGVALLGNDIRQKGDRSRTLMSLQLPGIPKKVMPYAEILSRNDLKNNGLAVVAIKVDTLKSNLTREGTHSNLTRQEPKG